MTSCPHTDSGCNSTESECAGLCTKPKLRFFPKPIPMPIEYAEDEPDDTFYIFDPWPLGVRLCAIAFVSIVAAVAVAVFYLN